MTYQKLEFLSTPSGWKATTCGSQWRPAYAISIHALRVEGDGGRRGNAPAGQADFYPRPPGGRRHVLNATDKTIIEFLSTPSGWKATMVQFDFTAAHVFLSTPSGWKATSYSHSVKTITEYFYPRPPGGRRPQQIRDMYDQGMKFLSTPSGWKATEHVAPETGRRIISIHALRVEGDWLRTGAGEMFKPHFYPRPPGGRRPFCTLWACRTSIFLSTPSGWKATVPLQL